MERLNVFDYHNWQSFLKDHYQSKKQSNPNWSYENWSRSLNLTASKYMISHMLSGRRRPSKVITAQLCGFFRFSEEEKKYFKFLIDVEKIEIDSTMAMHLISEVKYQLNLLYSNP
ncbi:MAG: hypothetical protein HOE90_06575 [Bacteriovoracaceae bacterium]|jgi:uncharacterized protein (TIGR02147 family)|nr:hypothetical protein [Bacteriovoracaceae bacterium]